MLAAEPARGRRLYLVALGEERPAAGSCSTTTGAPVERRDDVRDTASIVAMCELAGDLAGGGDLETLRSQLAQVRMVEQPPGIEEAEEAALALERMIGAPPRVAAGLSRRRRGRDTRARARAGLPKPIRPARRTDDSKCHPIGRINSGTGRRSGARDSHGHPGADNLLVIHIQAKTPAA